MLEVTSVSDWQLPGLGAGSRGAGGAGDAVPRGGAQRQPELGLQRGQAPALRLAQVIVTRYTCHGTRDTGHVTRDT